MGGVGKPYPGSTGGEFFNYYVDDSNKNTAEGEYSSTFGYNNKSKGKRSIVGGMANELNDPEGEQCLLFGYKNKISDLSTNTSKTDNMILLGQENTITKSVGSSSSDRVDAILGINNTITSSSSGYVSQCQIIGCNNELTSSASSKSIYQSQLLGSHLSITNTKTNNITVVGTYNNETTALTNPSVVIASGNAGYGRKNVIECTRDDCKILTNLQLASDTTAVNAIDAPADPANPTTNEQTLATLGSLHNLGMPRQLNVNPATPIAYDFANNTPIAIETDFSITIPTWAQYMRVFYISGPSGLGRRGEACIELGSTTAIYYSTCTYEVTSVGGVPTEYILNLVNIIWDSGNKTITMGPPIEQKYDLTTSTFSAATPLNLTNWFRIIGLRFEGTF